MEQAHYCRYCGSTSHNVDLCPKTETGSLKRAELYCTYCGGKDHTVEACPKSFYGSAKRTRDPKSVSDYFVKDK